MTSKKERPRKGGSYIRQASGSLKPAPRDAAPAQDEKSAAPADKKEG